jgi:hypothetical protein
MSDEQGDRCSPLFITHLSSLITRFHPFPIFAISGFPAHRPHEKQRMQVKV